MEPETMITSKQAANILRITPNTLRRWDKKGVIKSYRTEAGHRRFRFDDVMALDTFGGFFQLRELAVNELFESTEIDHKHVAVVAENSFVLQPAIYRNPIKFNELYWGNATRAKHLGDYIGVSIYSDDISDRLFHNQSLTTGGQLRSLFKRLPLAGWCFIEGANSATEYYRIHSFSIRKAFASEFFIAEPHNRWFVMQYIAVVADEYLERI